MKKIQVEKQDIRVALFNDQEYICLTDMMPSKDGEFFVSDWLRNRNTLEFLGIWESIHNPSFNYGEFAAIKSQSGLNHFKLSVKNYISLTNGKGIIAKAGRYGGTFAHQDIAFEFATWISPTFKLYLIQAFQKLKREEEKTLNWNAKRELAKINYHIHTDAVKKHLIPTLLNKKQILHTYANEADVLNVALFGKTAKQWRDENPTSDGNIRDMANVHELICISNLENINALLIEQGMSQENRLIKLNQLAIQQMTILIKSNSKQSTLFKK